MSSSDPMPTEVHDKPGEVVPIQPTYTLADVQKMNPADLTPAQKRMRRQILRNARGFKIRSKATRKSVNKRKK